MSSSQSEQIRKEGNTVYLQAIEDSDPISKKSNLNIAIALYEKALRLSTKQTEKASASKNIAMASWKMGKLLCEQGEATKLRHFHFKEAISNFNTAYTYGSCHVQLWIDGILQSMYSCIQDAISHFDAYFKFENQIFCINECINLTAVDHLQAECHLEVANLHFKEGLYALQKRDCMRCLKLMRDSYFPMEEARRWGKDQEHIQAEIATLERDTFLHTCMAESIQARLTGDNLLEQVLKEEEDLNMDMVWAVVDWFKQAALLTRENDVELEAIALSRLGKVYDSVLKMKVKAQENLKRSIQLAMSLHPRTFNSEEWFQYATQTLEKYQKQIVEQESEKWQRERADTIKELKDEIEKLEEVKDDAEELLQYVYKTHPPKDGRNKLGKIPDPCDKDYRAKLKKILQKAVTHYHPDRCNIEKHGKKWKVLCEEITKYLTGKYEGYK